MPCCGLHEQQQRVPLKYTIVGAVVFWGSFLVAAIFGFLTVWTVRGRGILHVQANFLRALWIEALRRRDSVPARLSCRLSGRVLGLSPRLAELIYRHPELPFIYAPVLGLVTLVAASIAVARAL